KGSCTGCRTAAFMSIRRSLVAEEYAREDVEHKHAQSDDQGAGPCEVLPVLVRTHGKLEDDDRQVRHRLVQIERPELVVEGSEKEGRGLPADTRDRKQDTGDDPGLRGAHG